ncbi:MAG TPA: double-strand break repair protein AddB [Acetobacteraceae bacterium]|nr:double-strand break repair protein AddB [Acetobacteraceae bacterium]
MTGPSANLSRYAREVYCLPPHVSLVDAVAHEWLRRTADPMARAGGLILLPTRRAARALADAFLRASEGAPLLLPRIIALGALDETPLALAGALDLPPAITPPQRLAALARLILARRGEGGAPRTADRAWLLAGELALLMDEAERAEIDLAQRLPDAADPAYAGHWARTLQFLHIVTAAWPAHLAETGLMNPVARQVALLNAQAADWERDPPVHPILVAGTTAGIPAVARLLRVVGRLPTGRVLLPAVDTALDAAIWNELEDSHPQAGLKRLLAGLDMVRGDLRPWPVQPSSSVPPRRFTTLGRALLPAKALDLWRAEPPAPLDDVARLSPADQHEEAAAIALVLRDALQTPGARAALVTPDRELAGRVAAELLRHGVVADDSAGEPLAETPPAVFLRLLTRAVAEELAPVPLLALLKHPLAAAGLSPAACRAAARSLEQECLRGPRPSPGLTGLRRAVDRARAPADAADLLQRIEACLAPTLRIASAIEVAPADALAALIDAAERLATTDEIPGPALLWAGEEGDMLATALTEVNAALRYLPDQRRAVLPGLLDAVLQGQVVRSRRALRGRGGQEHPRVFIWGLLEARLQTADTLVLGGLVEGVWPPATDPGPWLSRPMRTKTGLASPEEAVGAAAHDFVAAAMAAPRVVLSCPARREGAPAVPARWLTRIEMFLAGHGQRLPEHPAVAWVRALDQPAGRPRPVVPPRPCPPVPKRPRQLSVTEIETWLRDPYAIYARHVLNLAALRPLDEATDAADYGSLVHNGMRLFLAEHGTRWPPGAADHLRRAMARALAEAGLREALAAWWAPRLDRIANWVAQVEAERRARHQVLALKPEASGTFPSLRAGGRFVLTGRADRIERRDDGALAILDYKTGTPPTQKEVDAGLAPQLLLEAAMAAAAAFGSDYAGATGELAYWHLTGGYETGEVHSLFKGDPAAIAAAVAAACDSLGALIDAYDQPDRCYLSHPHPARAPRFSDYAQLARVAEWSAAGEEA